MRKRLTTVVAVSATLATLGAAASVSAGSEPPGTEAADTEAAGTEAAGSGADSEAPAFDGEIIVGSADFPESELLGQIYGQALEAAGFSVAFEPAIGSREVYLPAIENGELHLMPEYTGNLLNAVTDPDAEAATVEEQVEALAENLPDGLEVLTPSPAEDADTLVCTAAAVEEFGLSDFSSLADSAGDITIGAPPEFETRTPYGYEALQEALEVEFGEFVPLAFGDIPSALESGSIDCGNLNTTGSALIDNDNLVQLDDDLGVISPQNIVPLVRSEIVTPELADTLDSISAALTTEILTELVAQVEVDQLGADVVAAEWLASLAEGGDTTGPPASAAPSSEAPSSDAPSSDAASSEAPGSDA